MARIAVIGTGYVGLTTGAYLAHFGHDVICADVVPEKVDRLGRGEVPIVEAGLDELVRDGLERGTLHFVLGGATAVPDAEFVFLCVPTPQGDDGAADLSYIRAAAGEIAAHLQPGAVVINKSTVPVGSTKVVERALDRSDVFVVSNPEFLREGSAVYDCLNPDRIVVGGDDDGACHRVAALYDQLDAPVIICDAPSAETIKYASNAFLATRISFINEIAAICAAYGVDVKTVSRGMGLDKRIGVSTLEAGLGYGGSCFPKDIQALEHMAAIQGLHPELLRAVMEINRDQRRLVVQRLRDIFGSLDGRHIAVLGLSFKPNTDDVREAPALAVIRLLQAEGARVRAYDPVAVPAAQRLVSNVEFADSAYAAAAGCDALVVATEWNEFRQLDLGRLRESLRCPVVIDGRNIYDPTDMARLGFIYRGIGRGYDPIDQALIQSTTLAAL